ncbi:MAG TPA: radical SAM protein, partial [Limnochorda sp.]
DQFSRVILVKRNLPELLERELAKRSWRREPVAVGTATDPYQPAEGRYRITRRILELLLRYRTPADVVTKSPLILRDVDLLAELHRAAGVQVSISLATLDRGLVRALEPGSPPPAARLQALRRLSELGIPTGILVAPVLPGLTDGLASLAAVVRAAQQAGAAWLGHQVLRLCEGAREVYLERLEEILPELAASTRKLYRGQDLAPLRYRRVVARRLKAVLHRYPIPGEPPALNPPAPPPQAGEPRQVGQGPALAGRSSPGEPLFPAGERAEPGPVQTLLAWAAPTN